MRTARSLMVAVFIALFGLFWVVSAAHAEEWVEVDPMHDLSIDVDSIRKDADGLVYYTERNSSYDQKGKMSWVVDKGAYDCQKGLSFRRVGHPDWRSNAKKVSDWGTLSIKAMNFVCSRAR